ncbi:hypothetical protein LZ554_009482 [Drepanopeziza brunnea f. sp. 'monogermtubi']|nr:hypothetical protein LZ554_009482 [Drepanopeziza brunnea f. sp. 'monogermtubi']
MAWASSRKIFEVGNTMLEVLQACGAAALSAVNMSTAPDPFAEFVRKLGQTSSAQPQYANLLLARAAEKPVVQLFAMPGYSGLGDGSRAAGGGLGR